MHSLEPGASVYVPGPQPIHTIELFAPSSEEYFPSKQFWHALMVVEAPTRENVPAGQLVQALEPGISEYVPGMHARHTKELSVASREE